MQSGSTDRDRNYRGVSAPVARDLVEDLERLFKERTKPTDEFGAVMFRAGCRHVVALLREAHDHQTTPKNTHVLP